MQSTGRRRGAGEGGELGRFSLAADERQRVSSPDDAPVMMATLDMMKEGGVVVDLMKELVVKMMVQGTNEGSKGKGENSRPVRIRSPVQQPSDPAGLSTPCLPG